MTCALIAGVGPIPPQTPPLQMAPGLRLWSLARVALHANAHVMVASCDHFGHLPEGKDLNEIAGHSNTGVLHWPSETLAQSIDSALNTHAPDCVIATTDLVAAAVARRIPPEIPMWVDLYGDPLAEGQLLAAQHAHCGGLAPLAANMISLLARGDRFSVCSRAQRHAMLGELGLVGRLSAATSHRNLVTVLPGMAVTPPPTRIQPSPLRGPVIPEGAFSVLWCGGFNTWTDIDTLYEGLSLAMGLAPNLHFVCLGGAIDRHNPGTYAAFEEHVKVSPHRDRFHLLGWRPQSEVGGFVADADVGLNIDADCHEAELGTRTRLLEWAQAGIAICSTPNSEMTQDLIAAEALQPFAAGDPGSLSDALVHLASDLAARAALGARARAFVDRNWTPETVGQDLAEWIANPMIAPDRRPGAPGEGTNRLLDWMRALEPALRSDEAPPEDLAEQTHRLKSLEGSALIRLCDRLRRKS